MLKIWGRISSSNVGKVVLTARMFRHDGLRSLPAARGALDVLLG